MAIKMSPQEAAEKWARRLQQATPDIQQGIQRVDQNPMQAAARKKTKMLQRITDAVNSGKWERGLARVSLEDWKQAAIQKGLGRISAGVEAAQSKQSDFFSELLPYQAQLQAEIGKMPDLTLQDSVQRAAAWISGMAKFRRK